jgi:hypothetical protein
MKKKLQHQRDWHEQRIEDARKKQMTPESAKGTQRGPAAKRGLPETPASRATFPERTREPRDAGLANEARPGLGTRADDKDPSAIPNTPAKKSRSEEKPRATKHGHEEPRPEPREQAPDSMAHEQERSTGVSGHSGNT